MTPFFSMRFEFISDRHWDVLFVFLSTAAFNADSFSQLVENQIRSDFVPDQILLLVREHLCSDVCNQFDTSSILVSLKGRLGVDVSVFVIGYGEHGSVKEERIVAGPQSKLAIDMESIKRRALTRLFRQHGGFVSSSSYFHFENPSGRHTERFMRLSNILVRYSEIAFVAFCALPLIETTDEYVFIDTPCLFSVVTAMNDQLRTLNQARQPLFPHNFQSYQHDKQYGLTKTKFSFVLISASSSGGLAKELIKSGFPESRIFHVYFLGKSSSNYQVICNLSASPSNPDGYDDNKRVERQDQCRMCAEGSKPIPLQGDQFQIAGPQLEPVLIQESSSPKNLAQIFINYAGSQVFRLGIALTLDAAQRQFHIDAQSLSESEYFNTRFLRLIDKRIPARTSHMIAADKDSFRLVEAVQARLPQLRAELITAGEYSTLSKETTSPIVIVAAVTESGRALQDISRDLRSVCPDAPLVYIVGMAKSRSEKDWRRLVQSITKAASNHTCDNIDWLLLPASSVNHAWIKELQLLETPDFTNLLDDAEKGFVEKRLERLSMMSRPLIDDLFVSNSDDQKLKLTRGFVFWNTELPAMYSQADVYFTLSSVLQNLRAEDNRGKGEPKIQSNWFQQTILASENFSRFNDGLIQACILRSAEPAELNFASDEDASVAMARIVQRAIERCDTNLGDAAAEFLLAIASGRMHFRKQELTKILNHAPKSQSPAVRAFAKACSLVPERS
ncbi:MAG TPA: hypothetical protein V6C97_16445 [Oculatellaceae cyanobacterium]